MFIHLNGRLVPRSEATVSVFDHGLLYGDGVFEGIRAYEGNVFRLREHVERLYASAHAICLRIPVDREAMERAVLDTVAANELRDAYIRVVITRGEGDLGLDPASCVRPTVVVIAATVRVFDEDVHEDGLALVTASTRRIPVDSLDPRIKSLNYLNNVLARLEARNAGASEALMLNHAGRVAEGTVENVFVVRRGVLLTPCETEGILPGITRRAALDIAADLGLDARETALALHDLYTADECFLTGTGAEIVPVRSIDGREIGAQRPGPVTSAIRNEFRRLRVRDGRRVEYAAARA